MTTPSFFLVCQSIRELSREFGGAIEPNPAQDSFFSFLVHFRYSMEDLFEKIREIHTSGHQLCLQAFGKYFPSAGNVAVFCQSEVEFKKLTSLMREITETSDNPRQKYFSLQKPITVSTHNDMPSVAYTYLYIRKPDPSPYGQHRGDTDFIADPEVYRKKYDQEGVGTMIELYHPAVTSLAYLSTEQMTKSIRARH